MRTDKSTFSTLFILLVVMLVFLPFITTFQDVLTRIILHFDAYRALQKLVIPHEMRILATVLNFMHLPTRAGPSYIEFLRNGRTEVIYLAWNCIGWQSFIFLFITLISGLSGKYTNISKFQAFLIGLLGTYLINIFRLTIVVVMYYFTGRGIGIVFHDYFSNLLSISWLFIFWWIAYSYVLEETRVTFRVTSSGELIAGASNFSRLKSAAFVKLKTVLSKLKKKSD